MDALALNARVICNMLAQSGIMLACSLTPTGSHYLYAMGHLSLIELFQVGFRLQVFMDMAASLRLLGQL